MTHANDKQQTNQQQHEKKKKTRAYVERIVNMPAALDHVHEIKRADAKQDAQKNGGLIGDVAACGRDPGQTPHDTCVLQRNKMYNMHYQVSSTRL
jgi:hypothetical protein